MASRSSLQADTRKIEIPPGMPGWITGPLIQQTLETWQPYYNEPLTVEDACEMLIHVGRLIDLLEGIR